MKTVLWPPLICSNLLAIECSTLTESSFRFWSSSIGIWSPPPALFVVTLPKAHLTLNSSMSGSRWVITPSWLSGSWRSFFVLFCVFLPPLLNILCFCYVHTISILYCARLCLKCFLGSSNFLDEKSSLSRFFPSISISLFFSLYFLFFPSISLHWSLRKAFLSLCAIL